MNSSSKKTSRINLKSCETIPTRRSLSCQINGTRSDHTDVSKRDKTNSTSGSRLFTRKHRMAMCGTRLENLCEGSKEAEGHFHRNYKPENVENKTVGEYRVCLAKLCSQYQAITEINKKIISQVAIVLDQLNEKQKQLSPSELSSESEQLTSTGTYSGTTSDSDTVTHASAHANDDTENDQQPFNGTQKYQPAHSGRISSKNNSDVHLATPSTDFEQPRDTAHSRPQTKNHVQPIVSTYENELMSDGLKCDEKRACANVKSTTSLFIVSPVSEEGNARQCHEDAAILHSNDQNRSWYHFKGDLATWLAYIVIAFILSTRVNLVDRLVELLDSSAWSSAPSTVIMQKSVLFPWRYSYTRQFLSFLPGFKCA